jgi:hypothetical protein
MLPTMTNAADVLPALGSESECASRFEEACQRAGIPCEFPMTTEIGAAVLRDGLFYDLDAAWLRNLASSGGVTAVERGGRFLWSAQALSHAGCMAELYRRFQLHPAHAHKLHAVEVLQLQAEAAGELSIFDDIEHVACRDLLVMISQSNDPNVRTTLAVGLAAKLRQLGVSEK